MTSSFCSAHDGDVEFSLPESSGKGWVVTLTTADPIIGNKISARRVYLLSPRSLVLLSAKELNPAMKR